jgi:hypothetical protein
VSNLASVLNLALGVAQPGPQSVKFSTDANLTLGVGQSGITKCQI